MRKLEALFLVLVATMALSFFWTFGKRPPPAHDIAAGALQRSSAYGRTFFGGAPPILLCGPRRAPGDRPLLPTLY